MAEIPTCVWTGKSGKTYTYHVHPNPCSFSPSNPRKRGSHKGHIIFSSA